MIMFKTAIYREEVRNMNMINEYKKELKKLPKGKIIPKTINGNIYYYLYYRDGKKSLVNILEKNKKVY